MREAYLEEHNSGYKSRIADLQAISSPRKLLKKRGKQNGFSDGDDDDDENKFLRFSDSENENTSIMSLSDDEDTDKKPDVSDRISCEFAV